MVGRRFADAAHTPRGPHRGSRERQWHRGKAAEQPVDRGALVPGRVDMSGAAFREEGGLGSEDAAGC